ncbi:HAD family hydrolase [Natronococcus zhouii]|nr:HAD-IA family hydrolase [Natronococcus sp. CG52]
MDGVLLEGPGTPPRVYDRAVDAAIDALGLEPTERQRRDLRDHGYESVETACTALGVDPTAFWRRKEERASRLAADRIQSGERGIYEDVTALSELGERATLALMSNNRHETAAFVADYVSVSFATARGRDPTPAGFRRRKPKPDYLLETLAELDVESGLYVGDRETDVIAAEEAGLEPAYLRRSHNADAPLPTDATYELESLSDLAGIVDERPDG